MDRITELQQLIKESQEKIIDAKAEGDLRENSSYIEEVARLNKLQQELQLLRNVNNDEQLKHPWEPPTEVGSIIVMGVKIYHSEFDKPIVILPRNVLIKYLNNRQDFYPCSSKSEVAFGLLGQDISQIPEISKLAIWREN